MHTIETSIYTAVLITGIVLGGLLIYFAITISKKQRKHFKMLSRHTLAEMERLEQERIRIARDLHDELGPVLSVTQILIDVTPVENERGIALLKHAGENIKMLMERFAGIAHNLTPRVLEAKGLHAALTDFFERYKEVSKIRFVYEYKVKSTMETSTELHIYRMIQELVHNAVKHSNANVINVLLLERKNKLYVQCKDNGIGMESQVSKTEYGGLGVGSLRARTEMLGGKVFVSSKLKEGTEYFFEIPFSVKHEKNNKNSNSR